MAIWQYAVYLIPEAALAADGSLPGLLVTGESLEFPPLEFERPADELERLIERWLPPAKSWHGDLRRWGDDTRHDVEIWYEGGRIGHILVRIDLREASRAVLLRVLEIARGAGCCFLEARTLEVVPATVAALLESIGRSQPARFVQDPHDCFRRLAEEPKHKSEESGRDPA